MAGRTPTPAPQSKEPAMDMAVIEADVKALGTVADAEKEVMLAAGIEIGRLEMTTFFATIGEAAAVSIYENVKKSKAWKIAKRSDGRNFESLDEFCRVKLGKSYNRLQELTANRKLIGQDAFEQAERLGLRQVDYNAIKALPAPDQELIRRAVEESSSRDDVLGVLQELAARHANEKAALERNLADEQGERRSTEEILAKRNATITRLERDLKRNTPTTPDEKLGQALSDLSARANTALGYVRGGLRDGFEALAAFEQAGEKSHRGVMKGYLDDLQREIDILRSDYFLLNNPV